LIYERFFRKKMRCGPVYTDIHYLRFVLQLLYCRRVSGRAGRHLQPCAQFCHGFDLIVTAAR
jgi:hypothetical protein